MTENGFGEYKRELLFRLERLEEQGKETARSVDALSQEMQVFKRTAKALVYVAGLAGSAVTALVSKLGPALGNLFTQRGGG